MLLPLSEVFIFKPPGSQKSKPSLVASWEGGDHPKLHTPQKFHDLIPKMVIFKAGATGLEGKAHDFGARYPPLVNSGM